MKININSGFMKPTIALVVIVCAMTSFANAQSKDSKTLEQKNKEIVGKWLD